MLLALACHLGMAVIGQIFLASLYELTAVENGAPRDPNFFTGKAHGVHTLGVMSILSITGIWLIKFNCLVFFYRLGSHIATYRTWWWICFVFNVGCCAGCFGLFPYPCLFSSAEILFGTCTEVSTIGNSYINLAMTAVLDIVPDLASELSPACQLPRPR